MTRPDNERGWKTVARTRSYRGRVKLFTHTAMLEDTTEIAYEVDESIPFAVATLVVDGDDVLLTRQYRYPIDRWIYDLPGGAGAPKETPLRAAHRELEEELGLVPKELHPLHTFFVNPGRAAWPVHVFVCTGGTTPGRADRTDPAEQVRFVRMPVNEVDVLIASGEIVDPTLIIARAAAAARGVLPPIASAADSR